MKQWNVLLYDNVLKCLDTCVRKCVYKRKFCRMNLLHIIYFSVTKWLDDIWVVNFYFYLSPPWCILYYSWFVVYHYLSVNIHLVVFIAIIKNWNVAYNLIQLKWFPTSLDMQWTSKNRENLNMQCHVSLFWMNCYKEFKKYIQMKVIS